MKKLFYFLATAALGLTTACTSTDVIDNEEDAPKSASDITNSSVPIKLSTTVGSSVSTRAMVNPYDDNGNFNYPNMGIYCLATRQMENGLSLPISWGQFTPGGYSIWMENVSSRAEVKSDANSNNYTDIIWNDDRTRYYPTGAAHAYSFYGYAPRITNTTNNDIDDKITYSSDSITIRQRIDGSTDLLWGAAENLKEPYAYSAKYFRHNPALDGSATMAFKHLLMGLTVNIQAGADTLQNGKLSYEQARNTYVTGIRVLKVPTSVTYNLANRKSSKREGVVFATKGSNAVSFHDRGSNKFTPVAPDSTRLIPVGDTLLLPVPPAEGLNGVRADSLYEIQVDLAYHTKTAQGADTVIEAPMTLTNIPLRLKSGKRYQPGHYYVLNLTVYKYSKIGLHAKLDSWVKEEDAFSDWTTETD